MRLPTNVLTFLCALTFLSSVSTRLRVYGFELFECARKICLVGIPVFFAEENLQTEQLTLGLILCFLSFGVYSWIKPYRYQSDDNLQTVCQVSVFFALLSKIPLENPNISADTTVAVILGVMSLVPPLIAVKQTIQVLGGCAACCEELLKRPASRRQDEPAPGPVRIPSVYPSPVGVETRICDLCMPCTSRDPRSLERPTRPAREGGKIAGKARQAPSSWKRPEAGRGGHRTPPSC